MVAEAREWVDVEVATREWVRDALDTLGRRAFFGYSNAAVLPQVVVQRVGGVDTACRMQFDVWNDSKATACAVALQLASALDALASYSFQGVQLKGAVVEQVRWLPDDESDAPRYIVEAVIAAYAAPVTS